MGLTTLTNGTLADADEVMTNFNSTGKIQEIYESTGFDSTASGASGSDEQSHELTAITAANLANADYLVIKINARTVASGYNTSGDTGTVQIKMQTKYTGGSYADSLAYTTVRAAKGNTVNASNGHLQFEYIHTLTNDEKTNGVQVKLFSWCTSDGSGSATLTNIQTVLSLGY